MAVAEPAFLACRSHFSASARKYSARVCMLATSPEKGSNYRQSGDVPGAPGRRNRTSGFLAV
jgi:hypothetical protein